MRRSERWTESEVGGRDPTSFSEPECATRVVGSRAAASVGAALEDRPETMVCGVGQPLPSLRRRALVAARFIDYR